MLASITTIGEGTTPQAYVPTPEEFCDKCLEDYKEAYRVGTPPESATSYFLQTLGQCQELYGDKYNPVRYDVLATQRRRLKAFGKFPWIPLVGLVGVAILVKVLKQGKGLKGFIS